MSLLNLKLVVSILVRRKSNELGLRPATSNDPCGALSSKLSSQYTFKLPLLLHVIGAPSD